MVFLEISTVFDGDRKISPVLLIFIDNFSSLNKSRLTSKKTTKFIFQTNFEISY